jgi:hypothetical protein
MAHHCLITATYTIEQHCMRRLYLKRHFERIAYNGDPLMPLREYPVREILAVYSLSGMAASGELVEPDFYGVVPDVEGETGEEPEDTVYSLSLSPALFRGRGLAAIKAGYSCGEAGDPYGVPADLASACLELVLHF